MSDAQVPPRGGRSVAMTASLGAVSPLFVLSTNISNLEHLAYALLFVALYPVRNRKS
jgi:hypothetical protein